MSQGRRAHPGDAPHGVGHQPDAQSARRPGPLILAVALHLLLVGAVFVGELFRARQPETPSEPIAVELVQEQAAPEPEQQAEKQPDPALEKQAQAEQPPPEPEPEQERAELPPAVPLDLAPAFDAPKSQQNDQELTIGDKGSGPAVVATASEPPPPEPQKAAPEPPKVEPQPEPPPEPLKAETQAAPQEAPPAEPLPPDPEGVPALAQPKPASTAETQNPDADKPEQPDPKRFAFFAPVPKMEFESGPKASQTPAGNAMDSYTSRLYGMIVPIVRLPANLPPSARRRPLQVEFVVDGRGRLAGAVVARSSGVPSLDVAVLYAIRQAAPFPPTPHGKPLPLILDYEPP